MMGLGVFVQWIILVAENIYKWILLGTKEIERTATSMREPSGGVCGKQNTEEDIAENRHLWRLETVKRLIVA